jgi:hypothetical protein
MKTNDLNLTIEELRLLDCAAIVRAGTTPFDMKHWKCGSACCAVGDYCAARPDSELKLFIYCDCPVPTLGRGTWYLVSMHAVCRYFGLSEQQGDALFGPDLKSDREEVAQRIEDFVHDAVADRCA